jgi:hypothetical protein
MRLVLTSSLLAVLLACNATSVGPNHGHPDGGGGGGGDGAPGNGADATCANVHFTPKPTIPTVELLIDRSGSMATAMNGTTTTRYQAIHDALVGPQGVVTTLQGSVNFGATLFSDDGASCPTLDKTPTRALNNLSAIQTLIESKGPGADTPTPQSISAVVADFATMPAPQGSPPVIVLATDGLPNDCNNPNNDTSTLSIVAATLAHAAGIKLFIIGIAGVNDSFLQQMANAGAGVGLLQANAPYYTSNSPQDMANAFQTIISGVASCDLAITGKVDPMQASTGTVTLNGSTLTYGTDWTVTNNSTLELLGTACTTFKSGSNQTVDATFPCQAIIE